VNWEVTSKKRCFLDPGPYVPVSSACCAWAMCTYNMAQSVREKRQL
jgi:hypothetical protein